MCAGDSTKPKPSIPALLALLLILAAVVGVAARGFSRPITGARETQGAAITTNLMKDGVSGLLYPRVDFAGDAPGYVLMEFPLVNAMAAFFSLLFPDLGESAFKLPSILLSLVAIGALFDLVALQLGFIPGLVAAGVFAFYPLHLEMAASPRPDESGLALALLSLSLFQRYLMHGRRLTAAAAFTIFALATLAKSTNAFALVVMIGWAVAHRGIRGALQRPLVIGCLLGSLPVALWTLHASRVNATSYVWEGRAVLDAVAGHAWQKGRLVYFLSAGFYAGLLTRLAVGSSVVGLVLAAPGVLACVLRRSRLRFVVPLLLGVIVYVAMFPDHTYAHDYYSFALLPLVAVLSAEAVAGFRDLAIRWPRFLTPVLAGSVILLVASFGVPDALARITAVNQQKVEFGKAAERIVPVTDLMIVSAYSIPAWDGSIVYRTGRRAWKYSARILDESNPQDMRELAEFKSKKKLFAKGRREIPIYVSKDSALTPDKLEELRLRGARYFGFMGDPNDWARWQRTLAHYMLARYPVCEIAPNWLFVDLTRPGESGESTVPSPSEPLADDDGRFRAEADTPSRVWLCTASSPTTNEWRSDSASVETPAFEGLLDADLFDPGSRLLEAAPRRDRP